MYHKRKQMSCTCHIIHENPSRALSCPQYTNLFCVLRRQTRVVEWGSGMSAGCDLPAIQASTNGGSDSSRACSPEYPGNKQALKHHQDRSVQRHEVRT